MGFCNGCIFNLLFPFSTCSHKWVVMKNLIPCRALLLIRAYSFTPLPAHPYLFLFHLSSSIPPSLIHPLSTSSVWIMYTAFSEKRARQERRCWIGRRAQCLTYFPPMLCCFWQFSCNIVHAHTYNTEGTHSFTCIRTCKHMHVRKHTVQWIPLLLQSLLTQP